MIQLVLRDNDYRYETENIIRLFFPDKSISAHEGDFGYIETGKNGLDVSVTVSLLGKALKNSCRADSEGECETAVCALLFEALSTITGLQPEWGIQTGVRPTKLLRGLIERHGEQFAREYFLKTLKTSEQKYNLALLTLNNQKRLTNALLPRCFSLYISIPFCRSRCSYCSFISHDVAKSAGLIPEYIKLLVKEIEYTAALTKRLGLKLQTIYVGGGTPTAVEAKQLECVLNAVSDSFDISGLLEYTVEAGRPDTVTPEKLRVIKAAGADRISINPQTINDDVLRAVRRSHTAADFYNAYDMAVRNGFDKINTDLIAGLPSDTPQSFYATIDGITALSPSNVTVHTLSIKRSSRLVYKSEAEYNAEGGGVSDMLKYSHEALSKHMYEPYYMYRQSKMAGNNENVGWTKPDCGGYYNVFIMEELQSILAVGAGASTKLVDGERIKRIFNYKYPYEYIRDFDEMLARKDKVTDFYSS